jgi:uncharacterized protein (TIGR02246 family)
VITENDEQAIRKLDEAWETAWNQRDMQSLASLVTPEVDFVTVMGGWLGGRETFQNYHTAIHETQFKNATQRFRGMAIRPLSPDICIVHMNWTNAGDTDRDGTPPYVVMVPRRKSVSAAARTFVSQSLPPGKGSIMSDISIDRLKVLRDAREEGRLEDRELRSRPKGHLDDT